MKIKEAQSLVDQWIKSIGIRYFNELTNTTILMEEVGEFARIVSRTFGEQSFKKTTTKEEAHLMLKEELADILFVIICLGNQMDINLEEALVESINKKTKRDADRHKNNEKLNDE